MKSPDRIVEHETQLQARSAAVEEVSKHKGSTWTMETLGYSVIRPDYSETYHRVVKMHEYSADH
jgi:hypothetical protein